MGVGDCQFMVTSRSRVVSRFSMKSDTWPFCGLCVATMSMTGTSSFAGEVGAEPGGLDWDTFSHPTWRIEHAALRILKRPGVKDSKWSGGWSVPHGS